MREGFGPRAFFCDSYLSVGPMISCANGSFPAVLSCRISARLKLRKHLGLCSFAFGRSTAWASRGPLRL
jgi:hypothetical protein